MIIGKPSLYGLTEKIFVKLIRFTPEWIALTKSLQAKLERLEILYTEQDYTIQTLNDMVARQDQEISRLTLSIERIQEQLKALRNAQASDISSEIEKPPHY